MPFPFDFPFDFDEDSSPPTGGGAGVATVPHKGGANQTYAHVFNCSGESVGIITDWTRLSIVRKVNTPAEATLEMDSRDESIELLGLDFQVQFWRKMPKVPSYKEVDCLFRSGSWAWDSTGQGIFVAKLYGLESLLSRRTLLGGDADYYDGSWTAERCMKVSVGVQCGVAGSREFAQVGIPGLTVLDSADRGPNYSGYQRGTNLLQHLQNIGTMGMAFRIASDTPGDYIFDAYPIPFGTDRTVVGLDKSTGRNAAGVIPVIFSKQHGNVESISYASIRDSEGTVAVDPASLETYYSTGYTDSPLNHWEISFRPQTAQLPASAAQYALNQMKARDTVKAKLLQTESCSYGKDYFLGDWVTVVVQGKNLYRELTQIISGVTWSVEYQEGAPVESIDIELTSGIVGGNPLQETLSNLTRRIKYLELSS